MPPRAQWEAAARAPASAKKRYKSYLAPLGWASPYLACIALALTLTLPLPLTRLGLTLPGVLLVHAALPFWATLLGSARAQAVLHTCTPAHLHPPAHLHTCTHLLHHCIHLPPACHHHLPPPPATTTCLAGRAARRTRCRCGAAHRHDAPPPRGGPLAP